MKTSRTAFSLIELLVALSILGVVAAIVVPKLIGVQGAATATVAAQMQDELNKAWGQWKDAGGQFKNSSFTPTFWSAADTGGTSNAGVYDLLSSPAGTNFASNDGKTTPTYKAPSMQDGGSSNEVRVTFPTDITQTPPDTMVSQYNMSTDANTAYCDNKQVMIVFNGSSFSAFPTSAMLQNLSWNDMPSGSNPYPIYFANAYGSCPIYPSTFISYSGPDLSTTVPAVSSGQASVTLVQYAYSNGTFYRATYQISYAGMQNTYYYTGGNFMQPSTVINFTLSTATAH